MAISLHYFYRHFYLWVLFWQTRKKRIQSDIKVKLLFNYIISSIFHPLDKIFPQKCCCHFKSLNCIFLKEVLLLCKSYSSIFRGLPCWHRITRNRTKTPHTTQGSTGTGAPVAVFRCFLMMNDNVKLLLEGSIQ